ncbi:MAG: helix-turn-helix domain-containing protein [Deltaproteobacteria bacterium]|nr:helix-turn-helix domain-containing protein [Deltaproteobacteria bacterium]
MESPGEHLKRERESRGFSLKKVFEVTRVPLKYLEAIEADDYDSLPQPAFVKGYIKAYCKFLGIDDNDSVLRFELYLREKSGKSYELTPLPNAADKRPQQIPSCYLKWIASGLAALGVIAVVVIYAVKHRGAPPVQPAAQAQTAAPEQTKVLEPVVIEQPVKAAPEAKAPASGLSGKAVSDATTPAAVHPGKAAPTDQANLQRPSATAKAVQPSLPTAVSPEKQRVSRHTLYVKASEETWIKVRIDDATEPIDVLLRPGEAVSWKADDTFSLIIGNAGGVELLLDAAPVGTLGRSGEVVSLRLPRTGAPLSGQAEKAPGGNTGTAPYKVDKEAGKVDNAQSEKAAEAPSAPEQPVSEAPKD